MHKPINEGNQSIVYFSEKPTVSSNGLYVVFAGITHRSPDYYMFRTERSGIFWGGIYVLEYIKSGKGYIESEGKKYELRPGDFVFMNACRNFVYYSDRDDPYEKLWINFTGPFVNSLVSGLSLDRSLYICSYDGEKHISSMHRYLSKINEENRGYTLDKIAAELCNVFLSINSIERGKSKQIEDKKAATAEKIKDYIDSIVIPNLNLDELSRHFKLEKGYIIHRFTDKYGISPYKYINQKRIETAKNMLSDKNMKICEIASALGYNGSQHFSSSFKKAIGKTPSEFASGIK